jgi:tetratricopeptide (TPR) repeat protein
MTQTRGQEPIRRNVTRSVASKEAAYLRRVTTLEQQGLFDEAVQTLEKVIELAPSKASHCVKLSELYRAQRKLEPAIQAIKRAIELDPCDQTAFEALLQMYLESGRIDEAIGESKRVLKMHPRNIFARDVLGVAYFQKGYLDKALVVTTELIHLDPMDAANHFKKAVLFQQKGDVVRATEEFSRVIDLDVDGDISEAAREAIAVLDGYQLRQIATLATEDSLFLTKLLRDPESAVIERGFMLSLSGMMGLKQIDFETLPKQPRDPQRYYH